MSDQVLFLCTGNTCRSPLAEVMAQGQHAGLNIGFGSAGLQAVTGQPASAGSVVVAKEMGLDLTHHRSRLVSMDMLKATCWVIGMTRSHAAIFRARYGRGYTGAVGVLGLPGEDLSAGGFSPPAEEVADPFGDGSDHYQATGVQIHRLLRAWEQVFRKLKGNQT